MHSHHHLKDIFNLLWTKLAPKGSDVDLAFRMVMFHQSLCGCDDFPNMVDLTNEEMTSVIGQDQVFLHLMRIVMIADC